MSFEIEREAVRLTAMLSATENWSPYYAQTPDQHAALVTHEAQLQLVLTKFFKALQIQATNFVNPYQYNFQLQQHRTSLGKEKLDYDVSVVINDQTIEQNNGTFIKVTLQTVNRLITDGIAASEILYKIPFGVPTTSALIQNLSTEEVAKLVGKKVNYADDGTIDSIVDNPRAEYNIMETVRNDIANSVKTSLNLGETTDEAIERVKQVINPVERAELIAQTESVNAYQAGVTQFGKKTGAAGKEWLTAGATDVCAQYAELGPVPFDYEYGGSLQGPTAHPRCRCARRLIYPRQWDAMQH